ncbi:MAG TPA: heat-inducible transcriptional repressor HrcA [Gaiellaceae bacterium]|nr:heat-inducible transcriptional repressor HrcA [Gaiellaceae bacterium]
MQATHDLTEQLTERKRELLRRVVEEYVATGQPVGSRALVERARLDVSPSTVRHELAELEALGLLTHPHTSAGRVPTASGYRVYAEELVQTVEGGPALLGVGLRAMRDEIEDALRATTETLSRVTRLLALVSAPTLETATIRHVEVLALQPTAVMVVVITSTGGVTKRVFRLEEPVDRGLVSWAAAFLNERAVGERLGTRSLRRRLDDAELSPREREFVSLLAQAFLEPRPEELPEVFVGGAAGLLEEARAEEVEAAMRLLELLERRAAVLQLLSEALEPARPVVHVGPELAGARVAGASLVGATYGVRHTPLGAVGLVGPLRMDYEKAIRAVRAAAFELSRFVEDIYDEA